MRTGDGPQSSRRRGSEEPLGARSTPQRQPEHLRKQHRSMDVHPASSTGSRDAIYPSTATASNDSSSFSDEDTCIVFSAGFQDLLGDTQQKGTSARMAAACPLARATYCGVATYGSGIGMPGISDGHMQRIASVAQLKFARFAKMSYDRRHSYAPSASAMRRSRNPMLSSFPTGLDEASSIFEQLHGTAPGAPTQCTSLSGTHEDALAAALVQQQTRVPSSVSMRPPHVPASPLPSGSESASAAADAIAPAPLGVDLTSSVFGSIGPALSSFGGQQVDGLGSPLGEPGVDGGDAGDAFDRFWLHGMKLGSMDEGALLGDDYGHGPPPPARISMAWPPVAVAGRCSGVWLSLADGPGAEVDGGHAPMADAAPPLPGEGATPPSTLLVMAGTGLDVVAAVPVPSGATCVELPGSQLSPVGWGSLAEDPADAAFCAPASPPPVASDAAMRVLTLFNLSDGGAEISPAVNVLVASPTIADEVSAHFSVMAGHLLGLRQDPRLPYLQLRDVHGFTYLHGGAAMEAGGQPPDGLTSSSAASPPFALHEAFRRGGDAGSRRSDGAASTTPVDINRPLSEMTPAEAAACAEAWAAHFQPLMREVAFLLTCVPGAFGVGGGGGGGGGRGAVLEGLCGAVDGMGGMFDGVDATVPALGGETWDHRTYCKTLAGMVGYLEHHGCWATLSALLAHAASIGVRLCFRGASVRTTSLSPSALRELMASATHDDITVVYRRREPTRSGAACVDCGVGGGACWGDGAVPAGGCSCEQPTAGPTGGPPRWLVSSDSMLEDALDCWREQWLADEHGEGRGADGAAPGRAASGMGAAAVATTAAALRDGGGVELSAAAPRGPLGPLLARVAAGWDSLHMQLLLLILASAITVWTMQA